jgi:hypothetical protein
MILVRIVVMGLLVLGASAPALAADHCLSRNEQKAKAAAHTVVPLSRAMRSARAHGEIINARLCENGGHLVYLLTVLGGDGKVALASVDAGSGALIGVRGEEKKPEHAEDKKQDMHAQEKQDKPDKQEKKPEKK